jgi:hypothetical protein
MQLDPQFFPDPNTLGKRAMALAMLDAIICPESEYRYFSFDAAWGIDQQVGSMSNGDGDHWFLYLGAAGAAIKGYVSEPACGQAREMARQVQRNVPSEFSALLHEPAFMMDSVSYCYWRRAGERSWSQVAHPDAGLEDWSDGSADYLSILMAPASCYYDYASEYFECEPPLSSIEHLYAHAPLTAAIVESLNPRMSLEDAHAAARQIGYPSAPHAAAREALACSAA